MEKLFIKIVVMIVLVLFGLQCLDQFFYKDDPFRMAVKAYNEMDKEAESIIFLGSSHSYSSFDPRIIEYELNIESVNLGGSGQRLVTTQVVADMVLKKHRPKLVVISIFSMSLNEADTDAYKGLQLKTLDFTPTSPKKLQVVYEMFPVNEWPEAIFKTLRYHKDWHKPNDIRKPYNYKGNAESFNGFFTYPKQYDSSVYRSFKKKYDLRTKSIDSLTEKEKKRINSIIKLFSDKNIPILFVSAPSQAYIMSNEHYTYAKTIAKYVKSQNQPFLEFNESPFADNLFDSHFRNPNHLNTQGAIKATTFLVKHLKDSLSFKSKIQQIDLLDNRYAHVGEGFKRTLINTNLDSLTTRNSFGIESVHLYQNKENEYEIIFPLVSDSIGYQKFRLEHDVNEAEIKAYKRQRVFYNEEKTKAVFYGIFDQHDVLTYKNQSFVVFKFKSPLKEFRNIAFFGGDRRLTKVFSIDTLNTNPQN